MYVIYLHMYCNCLCTVFVCSNTREQIDLVVAVIDEVLSMMPAAGPEEIRLLANTPGTFKEDSAALARVQAHILRNGVGAGPTWEGHMGEEAEEDSTITVTFHSATNLAIGLVVGSALTAFLLRK
mmetsp:Transcript_39424/g.58014  ORF Transcript_39424/g.58014 Transcript_39424/m.58014 type:complete len:125 (+) Transcript_39424:8-382(+)